MNFKFNKSFLKNFIKIPIGVTTKKYINTIIIGETILLNSIPNFAQIRFKGLRSFELVSPSIKKRTLNIKNITDNKNIFKFILI